MNYMHPVLAEHVQRQPRAPHERTKVIAVSTCPINERDSLVLSSRSRPVEGDHEM